MSTQPVIDFHQHIICPEVMAQNKGRNVLWGWQQRDEPPNEQEMTLAPKMTQPDVSLADMDRLGIDVSVVSTATVMQYTGWAEPEEQARLEARANDEIKRWADHDSGRFVGAFTLPLRDMDLAMAELQRCTSEFGMKVVNLPAAVDGQYLGAPRFAPMWQAIHDQDLVAFLHPDGIHDEWFQDYWMWNSIGQPIEEVKVLTSLILEGVLERHPGLKVVVAHGGGFLPHYSGRLDRNVGNQPHTARNMSRLPSEYLADLYYDTCNYDQRVLEALLTLFGRERMVIGSDYPVGEPDPVGFIRAAEGSGERPEEVFSATAARLLGLA